MSTTNDYLICMAQTMLTYDAKISVFINAEQDEKGYLKTVSNIQMETKINLNVFMPSYNRPYKDSFNRECI